MEKRLFRNEHDKMIAGVASGLADYMQMDLTVVRLLFVLGTFGLFGTGLLVYIVMWIITPVNNDPIAKYNQFNEYFQKNKNTSSMFNSPNAFNNPTNSGPQTKWNTENVGTDFNQANDFKQFQKTNDTGRTIGGLILLVLGVYFLLRELNVMPEWFNIFKIYKLRPLAIVAIGISLIFKNQRKTEWDKFKKTTEEAQKSSPDKPVEDAIIVDENKDSTAPNS